MSEGDNSDVSKWVHNQLVAQGQEDIPDMLINYILLMMSNNKSVPEIKVELVDLLGEEDSATFCIALEGYYKEMGAASGTSAQPVGSQTPSTQPAESSKAVRGNAVNAGDEHGEIVEPGNAKAGRGGKAAKNRGKTDPRKDTTDSKPQTNSDEPKGNTRRKRSDERNRDTARDSGRDRDRGSRGAGPRGNILDRLGPPRERSRSRDREDHRGGADRRDNRGVRDRESRDGRDGRDNRRGGERDRDAFRNNRGSAGAGRPQDMHAMLAMQMDMMAQMSGFANADAMMQAQQQMMAQRGGFGGRGGRGGGRVSFRGGISGGRGASNGDAPGANQGEKKIGSASAAASAPVLDKKDATWVNPDVVAAEKARKQAEKEAKMSPEELAEEKKRQAHPMYADDDAGWGDSGGRGRGRGRGRGSTGARGSSMPGGRGRGFSGRAPPAQSFNTFPWSAGGYDQRGGYQGGRGAPRGSSRGGRGGGNPFAGGGGGSGSDPMSGGLSAPR